MAESDPNAEWNLTTSEEHDEVVTELAMLLMKREAISFGKFKLKSGRSPYLIDPGRLNFGMDVYNVGRLFSVTIGHIFGSDIDIIMGPPAISVGACQYYSHMHNAGARWSFPIYPGEDLPAKAFGGELTECNNVVVIDTILSTGDSLRQSISAAKQAGGMVRGACVLIDRRDHIRGRLAADDIERDTGVKVSACATILELAKKLTAEGLTEEQGEVLIKHANGD